MKKLILSLLIILLITGCQDNSPYKQKNTPSVMGMYHEGVNPNSLAKISASKAKDRLNKIELSKIDAKTKIEIAKINSTSQIKIAEVQAEAKKEVAKTDSTTKIKTSQIDAISKKDDIANQLYITMAIIAAILMALILLYLNNKKNRELKNKLHKETLEHERLLKEKEHNEQRLHKMLELVGKGKLPSEVEEEIILSITQSKQTTNVIESK
jgi:hypothetical protein